jgi:amino acid permease
MALVCALAAMMLFQYIVVWAYSVSPEISAVGTPIGFWGSPVVALVGWLAGLSLCRLFMTEAGRSEEAREE